MPVVRVFSLCFIPIADCFLCRPWMAGMWRSQSQRLRRSQPQNLPAAWQTAQVLHCLSSQHTSDWLLLLVSCVHSSTKARRPVPQLTDSVCKLVCHCFAQDFTYPARCNSLHLLQGRLQASRSPSWISRRRSPPRHGRWRSQNSLQGWSAASPATLPREHLQI